MNIYELFLLFLILLNSILLQYKINNINENYISVPTEKEQQSINNDIRNEYTNIIKIESNINDKNLKKIKQVTKTNKQKINNMKNEIKNLVSHNNDLIKEYEKNKKFS